MKKTIIAAAAAFLLAAPAMAGDISCSRVPQLRQKAVSGIAKAQAASGLPGTTGYQPNGWQNQRSTAIPVPSTQ